MQQPLQKPPGFRDPNTGSMPPPQPPGSRPPPRKPGLPPSLSPMKKRRSCCRCCCCCFCITLIIIIILIAIAAAVFYLWFDPKPPSFHMGSFQIQQFKISKTPDGASLTARTIARVEMKNPNGKLKFYYGDTDVEVSVGQGDDETDVGSTTVPGFVQGAKNTTSLKVETQMKNQLVTDGAAKRLVSKYKSKDLVVNVAAKSKFGLGVGALKIGMLGVTLQCGGVSMSKLESASPKCSLNTLKWINIK